MADFGKLLVALGLLLVVVGAVLLVASRFGLSFGLSFGLRLGRLPGDLRWRSRGGQTQVYFPIATCILLSVVLTLLLWLLRAFRR